MNKIITAALLLSAVIATPAVAADLPIYVGGSMGTTTSSTQPMMTFGGLVGYKLDKSATPFMASGSLAIEGHYTSLGSASVDLGANSSYYITFQSMGVDAVAMFPISAVKNLSAFGKLGFATTSITYTYSTNGIDSTPITSAASSLVYGFGAQYDLDNKLAVRAGYQTYSALASNIYVSGIYSF